MVTTDRIAGSALALFALGVIWESRTLPLGTFRAPGPAYMPVLLALLLLIFGVLIAATGGRAEGFSAVGWAAWRHPTAIFVVCIFCALALERLGYRFTILAALTFLTKVVERKGYVLTLVFALGLALGSFFLFNTILRVPLPRGPFGI